MKSKKRIRLKLYILLLEIYFIIFGLLREGLNEFIRQIKIRNLSMRKETITQILLSHKI